MKLGDVLRSRSQPVQPRPVTFWVAGRGADLKQVKSKASAVLVHIDEGRREAVRVEALSDLRKRFPDQEIPREVVSDEILYRKLFEVLRDEDPSASGTYTKFADTVLELRDALTMGEAKKLDDEYQRYVEEEFPSDVSREDFDRMVEEARKNSCGDLLTSYGYEKCVRVLSFMAGRSSR